MSSPPNSFQVVFHEWNSNASTKTPHLSLSCAYLWLFVVSAIIVTHCRCATCWLSNTLPSTPFTAQIYYAQEEAQLILGPKYVYKHSRVHTYSHRHTHAMFQLHVIPLSKEVPGALKWWDQIPRTYRFHSLEEDSFNSRHLHSQSSYTPWEISPIYI